MLPGEWPGRWSTSKDRSPQSTTSPSSSTRVAGRRRDLSHHRHPGGRHRVDEQLRDVIASIAVRPEHRVAVVLGHERRAHRSREVGCFGPVDRPLLELVHAADVVGVAVGRHGEHAMTELMLDEVSERREPERGVDDEIAVTAAYVPHVAPQQRMHMRFGDERDAVADAPDDPPGVSDGQLAAYEQPLVLPQLGQA